MAFEPEPEREPLAGSSSLDEIKLQYGHIFTTITSGERDLTADAYSELNGVLEVLHLPPTIHDYVRTLRAAGVRIKLDNGPILREAYVQGNVAHFENLSAEMQALAATLLPCVLLFLLLSFRLLPERRTALQLTTRALS